MSAPGQTRPWHKKKAGLTTGFSVGTGRAWGVGDSPSRSDNVRKGVGFQRSRFIPVRPCRFFARHGFVLPPRRQPRPRRLPRLPRLRPPEYPPSCGLSTDLPAICPRRCPSRLRCEHLSLPSKHSRRPACPPSRRSSGQRASAASHPSIAQPARYQRRSRRLLGGQGFSSEMSSWPCRTPAGQKVSCHGQTNMSARSSCAHSGRNGEVRKSPGIRVDRQERHPYVPPHFPGGSTPPRARSSAGRATDF